MEKSQFDSLYIPTKAGQDAQAIRRARTLLSFDWMESAVTCKVWRASRSWNCARADCCHRRACCILVVFSGPRSITFSVLSVYSV